MYTSDTRVLHLGNVANTGQNLVDYAQSQERAWALRNLPASPSLASPKAWLERGADALHYSLGHAKPDLVHIHYGPNGYYGSLKTAPFVLHLHGTDLREDLHKPILGQLERHALKRAAKVVVATPDLLDAARQVRSDALYIPNPVPKDALSNASPVVTPRPDRVVFSARWDDTKGGEDLLHAVRTLVNEGLEVVGVDWGELAPEAKDAGAILKPKMAPGEFRDFLATGEVVVGQVSFGSLGISDLEAMSTGRPLVTSVDTRLEGDAPVRQTTRDSLAEDVLSVLSSPDESEQLGRAGRHWVSRERSPRRTLSLLEELYSQILL